MAQSATMNGRHLVLCFVICFLAPHVAQAQIAMSTYVSESTVALPSSCASCSIPVIQLVLGDDNKLTSYFYTFCGDNPSSFTLSVGVGNAPSTYFSVAGCASNQFLALDPTKSTKASQFYWDCKQAFLYKCRDYSVFDQAIDRCILVGGTLSAGSPPLAQCGAKPVPVPVSASVCESLFARSLPTVCSTCRRPLVQSVLDTKNLATGAQYTYCADDGRFSLDIVQDVYAHAFFAPDCRGRIVQAIDATRTSAAAKMYWDCRFGLKACEANKLFDPASNMCTPYDPVAIRLVTGLETCQAACGARPPFGFPYSARMSYP